MEVNNTTNNFYTDITDKSVVIDKPTISQPLTPSVTQKVKTYQDESIQNAHTDTKLSQKEMEELIKDLNKEIGVLSTDLKFGFNSTAEMLEIAVINTKTDKVIRRFPTEEAVHLMSTMKKFIGMLFDTKG